MSQLALPVSVSLAEIERKKTLGQVLTLTYEAADLTPKEVCYRLGCNKAQLSRWEGGAEGIIWPKFNDLMDVCGNDVPVLWMAHQRGFDLHAMRRRESELEQRLRLVTEERDALKRALIGGQT